MIVLSVSFLVHIPLKQFKRGQLPDSLKQLYLFLNPVSKKCACNLVVPDLILTTSTCLEILHYSLKDIIR